jgi:hypothetical protein
MTRAPGVLRVHVLLQAAVGLIDAAVQRQLRRARLEHVDRNLLQQRDRIVMAGPPQQRIEVAEEARALVVPAPPEVARDGRQPLMHRRHELSERAGVADDRGDLPAGGHEPPHVLLAEPAGFRRLHDEHALQDAAVRDRHAEKRAIGILARVLEILEPRMRARVLDDDRTNLLGDESDQPFGEPHAHAPDTVGPQANRAGQHQARTIGFEQVDGTDVGGKPAVNQVDDVGQRLGGVAVTRDQLRDVVGRQRQGAQLLRREGVSVHGASGKSGDGNSRDGSKNAACLRRRARASATPARTTNHTLSSGVDGRTT